MFLDWEAIISNNYEAELNESKWTVSLNMNLGRLDINTPGLLFPFDYLCSTSCFLLMVAFSRKSSNSLQNTLVVLTFNHSYYV